MRTVSYTHLDVYKRQPKRFYNKVKEKFWPALTPKGLNTTPKGLKI